jgi:glycosyltransferase involved in cell wall biosynthesis
MRILFIAPRFHTNQISLVNKLLEEGHQLDFFVMGKGNSEDYRAITPKVIPTSFLTKKYIKYFKKNVDIADFQKFAIPKIGEYYGMIRKFNPDVMVVRGGPEPVYSWCLFPFLFSRINIVYYTQSPKMVVAINPLRKIYDYLLSNRYKIKWYTPVLYEVNKKAKLKDLSYMDYVPFFIYPGVLEIKERFNDTAVNFLCVAKYEPRKNLSMLLEVATQLLRSHKSFKLTIIGSTGNDKREAFFESLKAEAEGKGLKDVIVLKKNVPFSQMEQHYQSHHVFLMPSIQEPASVSQLEAMANGLAVICSRDNGTAHYIKDQKNGFLIEPTLHELEKAMKKYLMQPDLINKHRQESLNLVKTDFNIEKNYQKLMKILNHRK